MKDWRSSPSADAEGASPRKIGVNLSGKRTVFSIFFCMENPCCFVSNFVFVQRKFRLSELSLFCFFRGKGEKIMAEFMTKVAEVNGVINTFVWVTIGLALLLGFLAEFEHLPIVDYLLGVVGVDVAIDVGMAIDELVAEIVAHIGKVELTLLLAHLGVENDVEQQVAQLLADALHIFVCDGVDQLKALLDGVAAEALEGLLPIPGALLAEGVHHLEQAGRSLKFLLIHIRCILFCCG